MPLLKLELPPGIVRSGTPSQSRGRYHDGNLVRWRDGAMQPVGGWRQRGDQSVIGAARAALAWKDNGGASWLAIGTHLGLFVTTQGGAVYDVTPDEYIDGRADATIGGGFGTGAFGAGAFGTPRSDVDQIQPATVWSLDSWGENLVGVTAEDGKIYEWSLNTAEQAVEIENAPTAAAIVVTEERILMALGADGNPRLVKHSTTQDNTTWTPSATNQARELALQTGGALMAGARFRGGVLILSDQDAHFASYLGPPLVYRYDRVGTGCGLAGRNALVVTDAGAFWMGTHGFWAFNQYVQPMDCDVGDYVFSDINRQQASKIWGFHLAGFSEVWWFYPSNASNECDRYVVLNYQQGYWNIGSLSRFCGVDKDPFRWPIMIDGEGRVLEHEVGLDHEGQQPFARGGPLDLGERVMSVSKYIPDETTLGDLTITFRTRYQPMGEETVRGPYPVAVETDLRFTGRLVDMEYRAVMPSDWRVGVPRLEIKARSGR